MIKDTLLFLWIFIFPILAWICQLLFKEKSEKQKPTLFQKIVLGFYLYIEIFVHIGGIFLLIFLYNNDGDFSGNFQEEFKEFLYRFCLFQIGILDMWFLMLVMPKYWFDCIVKLWCLITPPFEKKCEKFSKSHPQLFHLFVGGGLACSFPITIVLPIFLMLLHLESIQDIFIEQKVSFILIIFVLLFNPIFMFYQLKERLFKND